MPTPEINREPTGLHCVLASCENGMIIKKTRTVPAIPKSVVWNGDGPRPTKDTVTCYCNSCGVAYEPDVILKQIKTAP